MFEYKYAKLFILILLLSAFTFAGCKNELNGQNSEAVKQTEAAAKRDITDDLGRTVSIPRKVERAVSLAPNLTENIFAVGAGNRLVGVTSYCDYPQEAQKIAKVGDTINPNLEAIIALDPQIVFVSTASQIQAFTEQMERRNIAVFVSNPQDLDGVFKSLSQAGEIFGEREKAAALIDSLKKRTADIETKTANTKRIKTFVQISAEPLFTVGKTSFITDLINRAGGISLSADIAEAYPKISKETALAYQPEAIILTESEDNPAPDSIFENSPAVKNNKVFKIKADLLSRASPRIVDGLERLARALHPESFEN